MEKSHFLRYTYTLLHIHTYIHTHTYGDYIIRILQSRNEFNENKIIYKFGADIADVPFDSENES